MSKHLRDLIVEYARTQVEMSWAGSSPSASEREEVRAMADVARIKLQIQLGVALGGKFSLPKDVSK